MKTGLVKTILFTVISIVLAGCGNSHYYVLSTPKEPVETYAALGKSIGVQQVSVPHYFDKRLLAVAQSDSQIHFISSAVWAEDVSMGLTNRLIGHLQKTFHQPQVYAYPWDTQRQPVLKLKVQVTRFIAQGGMVYLDANWEIENLQTKKQHAQLFSTSVFTADDASSIIGSMNVAFSKLEAQIAQGMRRF